jgi:hypothetical protein
LRPELPQNLTLGQIRHTAGIVTQSEWRSLTRDEQDAVDALSWQIVWRCRQKRHPALEGEDCIFLTVRHVQRLLRAIGARKTGEKAAAAAIATMQARGWIEDTGRTKKPQRGEESVEGGKDSQPDIQHAYWWRVFRVPAISQAIMTLKPLGAYWQPQGAPRRVASLSAYLKRQGLISRPKRRARPNPGSVQWVFAHSGAAVSAASRSHSTSVFQSLCEKRLARETVPPFTQMTRRAVPRRGRAWRRVGRHRS